jgi:hypothetical protein
VERIDLKTGTSRIVLEKEGWLQGGLLALDNQIMLISRENSFISDDGFVWSAHTEQLPQELYQYSSLQFTQQENSILAFGRGALAIGDSIAELSLVTTVITDDIGTLDSSQVFWQRIEQFEGGYVALTSIYGKYHVLTSEDLTHWQVLASSQNGLINYSLLHDGRLLLFFSK